MLATIAFGVDYGGQVALAQRILSAPLALFGKNLSDIYHVRIGRHMTDRTMRATVLLVAATLGLAAAPCVILALWGGTIFSIVFGQGWREAGAATAILAPLMTFQLIGGVITRLLIEINRQELKLFAGLAMLISMLSSFVAGASYQWSPASTLVVMSALGCVISASWIAISVNAARSAAIRRGV
jgi:O-antigen/teichoic acid export membrane protein